MRGHIQRRGKRSWRLKFDVGRDPATGERMTRYVTVNGKRAEAEAELTRILRSLDTGAFVEPSKITVGDHLEHWLRIVEPTLASKTFERYSEIVRKHLIPALGKIPLAKLTAPQVEAYYADARRDGRRDGKGGLSERTILHHHRVLRKAIRKAVGVSLARDPMQNVEAPKPAKPEITFLEESELATLLNRARGTRMYMPVLLAATTGLRRGEVLALRWQDVDLTARTLKVCRSMEQTGAHGLRFKAPKSRRSKRVVALPALTVEALREHKAKQAAERVALGLGKDMAGLVFTTALGEPVSPRNFTKAFERLVTSASVRWITFHGLRHTHVAQLIRANVHPKVISDRVGHASVAFTLDTYGHLMSGLDEEAAGAVDASMRGILGR